MCWPRKVNSLQSLGQLPGASLVATLPRVKLHLCVWPCVSAPPTRDVKKPPSLLQHPSGQLQLSASVLGMTLLPFLTLMAPPRILLGS